ncbi:MAG: response regulator transcription factor [Leptolinea sp.]|jgi:DNA-binding response OmpR family regulator|nr:response regulator transcription factor [Leptolinea sp.]
MNTVNILVVEDDEIVARTVERSLRGHEFRVTVANSGVEGLKIARRQATDLIILDVIMPGMDGYAVCREVRADPLLANIPILFLTAKAKDEDRIAGFLAGADDYLTKPFNIDELILRIRAIMRRSRTHPRLEGDPTIETSSHIVPSPQEEPEVKDTGGKHQIAIGDYILNVKSYELKTHSRGKVRLTPVQFDLLYHLMSHPGEIFSPSRLLDEVWDYPSDAGSPDLVRVHIKNLRERIEPDPHEPQFIQTVAGYGYTIRAEEE